MTSTSAAPVRMGVFRRAQTTGVLLAGLGMFAGLAVVGVLASLTQQPWLLGSFGASCVLLFGFPTGPFSKPRNVLGGHLLSSLTGLLFLQLFRPGWLPMAAAAACAGMLMMVTDTVHPPAGSNPVIVFLSHPGWEFMVLPTLAGASALVVLAKLYWSIVRRLTPPPPQPAVAS